MSKRKWVVIIIFLIAFAIFADYGEYNTRIKEAVFLYPEWEPLLRLAFPYKPFIWQFLGPKFSLSLQ